MLIKLLAILLIAAQSVLPFSADACACDSHEATLDMASCCQQVDPEPCACACFLTVERTQEADPAALTHAPRPQLDAVFAEAEENCELVVVHSSQEWDRSSPIAVPGVPLPRAERAPPA